MKVLYVINNLYSKGNGLCRAVKNNIVLLKERGIEVRVLSGPNHYGPDKTDFLLKDLNIPLFNPLVTKHGYQFAKVNKKVIKEAVMWADVIHIEEPFGVQVATVRIAKKLNVPCVATYHLHPENIFASVRMDKSKILNGILMFFWKHFVYNKCKIVHCPSKNTYDRLKNSGFKSELRMFSNGIDPDTLLHVDKKYVDKNEYSIVSIGRYAYEKDLLTIIKALKYSKYKDKIQLTLAGRGPEEKILKKYASKLYKKGIIKKEVKFGFFDLNELQLLAEDADLYIHAAFIEVEGLSCMEAIQTGLVPIIAKGKWSATPQFALEDNSKFKPRKPKDLAKKIDYWLSDNKRRYDESLKYKSFNDKYNINNSIDELIKMYEDASKK